MAQLSKFLGCIPPPRVLFWSIDLKNATRIKWFYKPAYVRRRSKNYTSVISRWPTML